MRMAEALLSNPRRLAPRRHEEDDIQAGITAYLRTVLPTTFRVFAIPNGGPRSKAQAAILKRTGVLSGVPDLCILGPGGASYWIETKAPGGFLSKSQREMRDWMALIRAPWVVAHTIDDVRAALQQWGLPTREAA